MRNDFADVDFFDIVFAEGFFKESFDGDCLSDKLMELVFLIFAEVFQFIAIEKEFIFSQ